MPAGLGMSFDFDQVEAPGTTGYYNSAFHKCVPQWGVGLLECGCHVAGWMECGMLDLIEKHGDGCESKKVLRG